MKATDEAKQPDHAGVAFHPPLLLLASLGAGFLLRWLAPLSVSTSTVPAMIGPAIVALAFAIFFWAVVTMLRGHASIPTNKPTDAIVAGGPRSWFFAAHWLSARPPLLSSIVRRKTCAHQRPCDP